MADEINPTPLPSPVRQDESHESLVSESDMENVESEISLRLFEWESDWGDKNMSDGDIGDNIGKTIISRHQEKSDAKVASAQVFGDDEEHGQLKDIFFKLIPSEITELIFNRLDHASKLSSRSVCKRWNDLIDTGNILTWSPELFDDSSKQVMTFIQKGYDVKMLEISKLTSFLYPVKGLGMNTTGIHFNAESGPIRSCGISDTNLDKLLHEYHYQIQELLLNSRAFAAVNLPSPFRTLDFPNLVSLEISTSNADGRGYYICLDALENTFPKLKAIKLRLLYHRETIFLQHPPYYKDIFGFIVKHAPTLENVTVSHCNLADERSIQPFVFDMDHSIPTRVYQGLMDDLGQIQLKEFTFGPTFYEGRSRFLFGIQLLNAQNQLTSLKLVNLSRPNFAVWESAMRLMTRCSSTLKSISCDGCFCPENRPLDIFSCSILSPCKMLTNIQIAICGLKITDVELLPRSVQTLHLGRGLGAAQIEFICNNLHKLCEWSLPQDRAQFDRTIPKTSVAIFKGAVRLPKLKTLILTKRCSSWKRIRKIISYTQGLEIAERDPNDVKDGYYVKIIIDRNRLELDRL